MDYATAVQRALTRFESDNVETAWSDALGSSRLSATPVMLTTLDGTIVERRQLTVRATPERVFPGLQPASAA